MSKYFQMRKAAVLGAGVMGAQIAAHLVNVNVETLLFELPSRDGDPNGNVNKALGGLKKLDPPPFSSPNRITYIQSANHAQFLEKLRVCGAAAQRAGAEALQSRTHRQVPRLQCGRRAAGDYWYWPERGDSTYAEAGGGWPRGCESAGLGDTYGDFTAWVASQETEIWHGDDVHRDGHGGSRHF